MGMGNEGGGGVQRGMPGDKSWVRRCGDESKACGGGDRDDGWWRSETLARVALMAGGDRFRLIVVRRLCFG